MVTFIKSDKIGAEERNRTADLLITNQLLYRLSYFGYQREYTMTFSVQQWTKSVTFLESLYNENNIGL